MAVSVDEQRAYWRDCDVAHFAWQTEGAYIAETERALIEAVSVERGERLLEIGCGEGGNLHHLRGRGARLYGVDFTAAKARFAARTGAATAQANAEALPFSDGAFDAVLVRDLLHHVPDRARVLDEARRVLAPGGRLTVIEPNGRNPLIAAQAALVNAERGMLSSTGARLLDEVTRAGFVEATLARAQPLPLSRVILHYKVGAPSLGRVPQVARALGAIERALARLPSAMWAYLIVRARKRPAQTAPQKGGTT